MTIARNMTLFVLLSSLTMLAGAVGCGERSSGGQGAEPSAALPASADGQGSEQTEEASMNGKAEAEVAAATAESETLPRGQQAPEPDPAQDPELRSSEGLALDRLVVASGVEDREPRGAASEFAAGTERIYAFVEAANARGQEASLQVTFEGPGGRSVGHVELTVPADAPRWRTWAYTRLIDEPGQWQAVVRTAEGEVLGRRSFRID